MQEMQPSASNAAAMPVAYETVAPVAMEDFEFALGCECADPALQIERWNQEAIYVGTAS